MYENIRSPILQKQLFQCVPGAAGQNIVNRDGHNTFHGMVVLMLLSEKNKRVNSRLPSKEIVKNAKMPFHFIKSPK